MRNVTQNSAILTNPSTIKENYARETYKTVQAIQYITRFSGEKSCSRSTKHKTVIMTICTMVKFRRKVQEQFEANPVQLFRAV